MKKRINIIGERFYNLVVKKFYKSKGGLSYWICQCDCGKEKIIQGGHLKSNSVKSCGCLKGKMIADKIKKHNLSYSSEYKIWANMKDRCYNEKSDNYHNYGGRGIIVCKEWINSFEKFYSDMGKRPSSKHSINRIDNNGNYEPNNCCWATKTQQDRNKRNNRKVINTQTNEIFNTISEVVDVTKIKRTTLLNQLTGISPNKTNFKLLQ